MNNKKTFTKEFTAKIANLSKLTLEKKELVYFTDQFNKTLETISNLNTLNTKNFPGVYNVTGLKNVFREDTVDSKRMFSQEEALSNAKRSYKGFFVVKGIFDNI